MTVKQLQELCGFDILNLADPNREINGVYIGDLLSWVMGRAKSDNVWITIMSNVNVMAVASLTDASTIVLAEGVTLTDDVLSVAKDKEINVLKSDMPIYEVAIKIAEIS